ncbi:helix-turn-helix transcriptional regulator [Bradyrhizobium sp. USDA 4454]
MAVRGEIFVGRHRELDTLSTALNTACDGHGRLVLVAGEPGIGKTRTALQVAAMASKRDAVIAWGRCHEEAGAPPYRPWAQLLGAVASSQDAGDLRTDLGSGGPDIAEIVPDIRARLPDLDPAAALSDPSESRFRLFGSIVRFLLNFSQRRPLVLILDDLHWADAPTLRLLEFLTQEIADNRLLVIGTYRDTDVSRRHQLSDTLGALIRVPQALRLHLSGLDIADVRQFAATAAGMTLPPWLTSAIHSQTEGNPLFVREVVRFLEQEGHLKLASSAMIPATIRLPEGIREAIGRRLNLLSAACNDVLATAAVIGHELRLDVLIRASRPYTEEAILEAVDEALATHILEEIGSALYQFTHTLVRITLYDELRTGERRRRHNAVGEAIEMVHRHDLTPVLSNLAHHFRAAALGSTVDRAIDYATRAGHNADAALASEEAVDLFRNALDMLDTKETDEPERRCHLLLALAQSQRKVHDQGAPETLLAAADIARSLKLYDVLAEIALCYAEVIVRYVAEAAPGHDEFLQEVLDLLPPSELGLRIRLMGSLARVRLHAGRLDEARAIGSHAIAMARQQGDPATLATALAGLAEFPWQPHETQENLRDAIEMADAGARANDLEVVSRAQFRRAILLLELGDIKGASAAVDEMACVNVHLRQPFFDAYQHAIRGRLALMRGAFDEAEEAIRLIQGMRAHNMPVNDPAAQMIFTLRRERGQLGAVGPVIAMFLRQTPAVAVWRPALALIYVEVGDLHSARTVFDELASDDFRSLPVDARWTTCVAYLAEVCCALDDRARASRLYRLLLPWSGRNIGVGLECQGSSDRFLGLLATLEERWADADLHFEQGLAMNDRIGAIVAREHTRRDYADMLARRGAVGDRARASAFLDIAESHAKRLGLIALCQRIALTRQRLNDASAKGPMPDNLTGRELDVLRLIAIGRGNADIALALAIGQSTVATHVHNILTKTGCANRTEAAAYAARLGLT